jgi:two-component system OmpR family response regulator
MGLRCLVVDDDAAIRSLLSAYLQQHGMQVEALADGAALRRRLTQGSADVLVLDLMLPDDDGLALCQWARRVQFRPRVRLHGTDARSGHGLGLAIARDLAERDGRRVSLSNRPGGGLRV